MEAGHQRTKVHTRQCVHDIGSAMRDDPLLVARRHKTRALTTVLLQHDYQPLQEWPLLNSSTPLALKGANQWAVSLPAAHVVNGCIKHLLQRRGRTDTWRANRHMGQPHQEHAIKMHEHFVASVPSACVVLRDGVNGSN